MKYFCWGIVALALCVESCLAQARSPQEVAEQLAAVYGHKLDQVAYIPALPLVAKLRLSELTQDPKYAAEVERIVAPFLSGEKSPVPKSGSEQAGHLLFAELAARSTGQNRERWLTLCRAAADQIFDQDGQTLPIMPFHNEMSDAVFMAGPILAVTGKLTGERKYFDAAAGHFASMRKLCLREDGIYRHSPLCEAAWGRGNGFPALGLALALDAWPEDHPARGQLVREFQKHMAALKPFQDAKTGCWHQVIDHPESYDEYSCTCMIGFAVQRGIRRGWLKKEDYQPSVDRAWQAIEQRTSQDGTLVNVCTGTGKQKTLQDYFDRLAINGRDDRGGAMGLMFTSELMFARKALGGIDNGKRAESLSGKKIVFLGDSITQSGAYISFATYCLEKLYPQLDFDIYGLGLASETLSGLSEAGHANGAFPRPCLFERLGRLLERVQPQVVFACYGINDGIYQPLDPDRFAAFQKGVTRLIADCQAVGVTEIYLITPPIFDLTSQVGEFNYDSVMTEYAAWEKTLQAPGVQVLDLHSAMRKARDARTEPFSKDRVHPGEEGHLLMAKTILAALDVETSEESAASIKADPLFQLVDQKRRLRSAQWMKHIGYTREATVLPQPLGTIEQDVAKIQQEIDALRR